MQYRRASRRARRPDVIENLSLSVSSSLSPSFVVDVIAPHNTFHVLCVGGVSYWQYKIFPYIHLAPL